MFFAQMLFISVWNPIHRTASFSGIMIRLNMHVCAYVSVCKCMSVCLCRGACTCMFIHWAQPFLRYPFQCRHLPGSVGSYASAWLGSYTGYTRACRTSICHLCNRWLRLSWAMPQLSVWMKSIPLHTLQAFSLTPGSKNNVRMSQGNVRHLVAYRNILVGCLFSFR